MDWILFSWPTLLLLALGLRMALRLHYGARGPGAMDPIHDFLSICSWVLVWLGLIPAILAGIFSFFGLVVVMLAAATLVEVITQRRAAQRRSVCTLLALLVDRQQQIETPVLLSAQTLRGRVGRSARKLFSSLNLGVPLGRAMQENPRALPREAMAYVAAGESPKAEATALRELSQGGHSELTSLWRSCIDRISYLGCVLLVMLAVFAFLVIRIIPSYADIFREFDMELPPITQLAMAISNDFLTYLAVPTVIMVLIIMTLAIVVGLCYMCDIPVMRNWGDRLFRSRRTAEVLRILAIAAEQRQSIAIALERISRVYPSSVIRKQLSPAAAAINSGGGWQDALQTSRIVTPAEAALLKSAERTGGIPWALRQVATRREKRAVYRLASFLQVAYPVVIVLLGATVGFYVVSLFLPIVKLIRGMAL